jgi:phosphopantothenoylcysteine decarboxylase/phosphopantothenate--cysteine ligase
MASARTVVVGVSGGIAAYKACELVRWLRKRGHSVIVVMTASAGEFVTPLTFQTLSGNPVVSGMWGNQRPGFDLPPAAASKVTGRVEHVDVAEAADALVIAPATANLMARLVHGEAPDGLTAVALATPAPKILCPAMDLEMWRSAATQDNLRVLRARGWRVVGPGTGPLASGLDGPGRLEDVEVIGAAVEEVLVRRASLEGVRVLVGAGRTEEPLDPVRVLTNRSSGRMGFALAEAARDRGARVTLVAGPSSVDPPHGVERVPVTTAAEMLRAMESAAGEADLVLMAAAVADYRPQRASREKLKRSSSGATWALTLTATTDILASIASRRRAGQVFVGFALETSRGVANARAKLRAKGLDLVVLNAPADGIGGETNAVTLVEPGSARRLPRAPKREVAEAILDRAIALRKARGAKGASGSGKGAPARRTNQAAAPRSRVAASRRSRQAAAARRG